MKSIVPLTAVGLLVLFGIVGCAGAEYSARGGGDYVARLEEEGLTLVPSGIADLAEFTVTGQRYSVGRGGVLHIYDYETEDQASLDVARAGAGIAGNAHVYQAGNVIAVYLGSSLTAETKLQKVFGPRLY